ncbi:MAG: IPT/TIG domain-containing protein [Myxococcaceae bacterium]
MHPPRLPSTPVPRLLPSVLLALTVLGAACDEARPPLAAPVSIAPVKGSTRGGDRVAILGEGFLEGTVVLFDGVAASDVRTLRGVMTVVTPPHVEGEVRITLHDPVGRTVEVPTPYRYLQVADTSGRPMVVGATSTGNTGVRIVFSEPVRPGAENPGNYLMAQPNVNSEAAALLVLDGTLSEDGITVELVTASQNEVGYEVTVSNVRDLDGNPLAPPELLRDPTRANFAGTAPDAQGSLIDTDDDGLPDHVEQNGWVVTIRLSNGDLKQTIQTSDIYLADTDGDGLNDAQELSAGSNPRLRDSDGDTIEDAVEREAWHSSPTHQDSDGDGLGDASELRFGTSPIIDDTDGDGMADRDELFLFNRNALLADLPMPQIIVGEYSLAVNVTSTFTDETGTTHAVQSSKSSSVSQAQASSTGRSDTRSTEFTNQTSQSVGVEVSYGVKDGFGGKASISAGFEQTSARGFTSTVDSQTSRESQQSSERSSSEALEASEARSVSTSIDAAQIQATVNVANSGAVPFTLTNLELSVMRQDRSVGGIFRPVATLKPAGGDVLSINMGPFDSERGPIIFENTTIFPNVVDELIREPAGLVFKVANFDVLDANGGNFAFSSATINSRTAGLTFDFGDGRVESFRIATHAEFGPDGLPQGITIERALDVIGVSLVKNDTPLPDPAPQGSRRSVGTLVDTNGVERLVRVRGVQNDLRGTANPEKRFWTLRTNNEDITGDSDFSSLRLRAGHEYLLLYTRDVDQDGLHELEEQLYGSIDSAVDTDGDGLNDFEEVRTGWTVSVTPGSPRRVFSSPARPDSDLDGLSDSRERAFGTNPNASDSDGDGLSDRSELFDTFQVPLTDGDGDEFNDPVLVFSPFVDAAIFAGTNGQVALQAAGDDVQLVPVGTAVLAGLPVIGPGPNGVIDTVAAGAGIEIVRAVATIAPGANERCELLAVPPDVQVTPVGQTPAEGAVCIRPGASDFELKTTAVVGTDDYVRVAHARQFSLDPTRADTDFDGIPDGRELRVGINPNSRDSGRVTDTDQDGLTDDEEDAGWMVCPNGGACTRKYSNKNLADTDRDGMPDVFEFVIGSNPSNRDTDGDGLQDGEEFEVQNSYQHYAPNALATGVRRCTDAFACQLPSMTPSRTNVLRSDTDGDGLGDYEEVKTTWTVALAVSRTVSSDPNLADADGDQLNDQGEKAAGTDPGANDTDADGSNDGVEVAQGGGRAPLVPDQRIRLIGHAARVIGDCDTGNGGGNFEDSAPLYLDFPAGGSLEIQNFRACNGTDEGANCWGPENEAPFILKEGETFHIRFSSFQEEDDSGDPVLLGVDRDFSYKLTNRSESIVATDGTNGCRIELTFAINTDD